MNEEEINTLVVEDNPGDYRLLEISINMISTPSFRLDNVRTLEEAVKRLALRDYDVILLDLALPDSSGLETLNQIQKHASQIPVIVLTGLNSNETALQSVISGAQDYLVKGEMNGQQVSKSIFHSIERKRIQTELERQKNFVTALIDTMDALLVVLDREGRIVTFNRACEETTEFMSEEVRGKRFWDLFITPEGQKEVKDSFQNICNSRKNVRHQNYWKSRSGTDHFIMWNSIVVSDNKGDVEYVVSTGIDMSEQQEYQKALERSERKYRTILDQASDAILLADSRGVIMEANRRACELFGYSSEELAGLSTGELISRQEGDEFPMISLDLMRAGQRVIVERKLQRKNGTFFDAEISGRRVDDPSSDNYILQSIIRDITERKRSEENLRIISEEMRSLSRELQNFITTASYPIIEIDQNGRVVEWNQAAEKIIGFRKEEILNQNFLDSIEIRENQERVQRIIFESLEGKGTSNFELMTRTVDGIDLTLLFNTTPRRDARGEIKGVWCVAQNITGLSRNIEILLRMVDQRTIELRHSLEREKQLSNELKSALSKEKELNELKSRFISMVSHEFRTPMATIQSASDLLKIYGHRLTDEQKAERLEKIQAAIRNMTDLLNDVLNLSKADSGRLEIQTGTVNLNHLCRILLEELSDMDRGKHNLLLIEEEEECIIESDEKYIRHIIMNLLSNAAKYSPGGTDILLRVRCRKGSAVIVVRDEGIGIPESEKVRLFDPFFRGSNVGNISGTGLGLAIINRFVSLLQGEISVLSEESMGTVFKVTIPSF